MGRLIKLDDDGKIQYQGLLTSKEIENANDILDTLQQEIPIIEKELEELYGNTVQYKYYLGKCLGGFLTEFNISYNEKRDFWDEIKNFASKEKVNRKRDDGKKSARRSFFEQCYVLSQIDLEVVEKMPWKNWQDILDRKMDIDSRLLLWISKFDKSIPSKEWREVLKILNSYAKTHDTCVFSDDEMIELYDTFRIMAVNWLKLIDEFEKEHPKSAKIEKNNKKKRSVKFYNNCLQLKKEYRRQVDQDIINEAFEKAMK